MRGFFLVLVMAALSPNALYAADPPTKPAPQAEKLRPKTKVTFNVTSLKLSYGQTTTANVCATVTPVTRKARITFATNPAGVFEFTPVTDANCSGAAQIALQVKSLDDVCHAQVSILARFNNKTVGTLPSTVILPTSEVAHFVGDGGGIDDGCDTSGVGCYYRNYDVMFSGPPNEALVLSGLTVIELLSAKQQVGNTPNCPFVIGGIAPRTLAFSQTYQRWGMGDHLEIPAGSVSGACIDRYTQTVFVGACQVQTNTLTYTADNFGTRSITRTDEVPP